MSSVIHLLCNLPEPARDEAFETLLMRSGVRVERIVSHGHTSPASGWYDQSEDEWVLILKGAGQIEYANGRTVMLEMGDSLEIPAHTRHRVSWTAPGQDTIWLALFLDPEKRPAETGSMG